MQIMIVDTQTGKVTIEETPDEIVEEVTE